MHVEFDPETEQRIAAIRHCLADFAIYEKEHNARCDQFWEEYIKPLVDSAPDRSTRQDLLIRICGAGLYDEYGQRLNMPAAIATHKAYAFTAPSNTYLSPGGQTHGLQRSRRLRNLYLGLLRLARWDFLRH